MQSANIIKQSIWNAVENADSIGITGHVRPDGDCIGACLGMRKYIYNRYHDKKVYVYLIEKPGEIFQFLSGADEIITVCDDISHDLFITLDCGDKDRIEGFAKLFDKAAVRINIDHHVTNTSFGDINYFDGDKSSTCEILYDLFDYDYIDRYVAECLYTGIIHDTGVFKYSCTSPETYEAAAGLVKKGIDFTRIIDESFYEKTYIQNRLLGRCLTESRLLLDGRLVMSEATCDIMNEYNAVSSDLDGIVSSLLLTKGVDAALLVHHVSENEYKISLRAKGDLDVSKIAVAAGGGGHAKAAGATLTGDCQSELEKVIRLIEEGLNNPAR